MVEFPDFQMLQGVENEGVEVDLWWAQVSEVMLGGERQFTISSRFVLAICTICNKCNSSSEGRLSTTTSGLTPQGKSYSNPR